MMRHVVTAVAAAAAALGAASLRPALAQQPVRFDSSAFAPLRDDGNGVAALAARISIAFTGTIARDALESIAARARLNLTFDQRLQGLDTKLAIAAHDRTVAQALIEIARASGVSIRVSTTGQLIVTASPRPSAPAATGSREPTTAREPVTLPAVRTIAERNDRREFETRTAVSQVSISTREIGSAPRFFAEADVLRTAQLLPGVEARNDYSAGINVRGGEADQNLILLDGFPIYNPFHLGGLFGTFIDPTVGRLDIYTGAFPARFGGSLSSVLNVASAEDLRSGVHGTVETSLLATTLSLGGATEGGKGTWMIAGRRTYADAIAAGLGHSGFPYHFEDAQAHYAREFSGNTRLAFTAYTGDDLFAFTPSDGAPHSFGWGNSLAGVSLSRMLDSGRRLFGMPAADSMRIEQRLSTSRFGVDVKISGGAFTLAGGVADVRASGSLTRYSSRHERSVGYDLASQHLTYSTNYPIWVLPGDSLGNRSQSGGVYYDEIWRPNARWIVESGARVDAIGSPRWSAFLPRLSVKYFVTDDLALTAAVGEYAQWIRSLAREDAPIRALDFWVSSDSTHPPARARHVVLGAERRLAGARTFKVEAFYKSYSNLVEPNPLDDPLRRGDEFLAVGGRSYGADLMLRQFDTGKFTGWLAYAYAVSTRIDAAGARFAPGQDRRHDLNAVGSWRLARYTLGARFNLASGTPYTNVLADYDRRVYDPTTHSYVTDGQDRQFIVGPRNSERLPLSQRLDLSLTRNPREGGITISPYLSVVNVYNAQNVLAYIYDYSVAPARRLGVPQLPIFPTLGVSIAW